MTHNFSQAAAYAMFNALQTVALTPATRAYLEATDPQALTQVIEALACAGRSSRGATDESSAVGNR